MIRGAIYNLDAYEQGKMLDSSSWNGFLPRMITPSDIDHVFDNSGRMLFVEFSKDYLKRTWGDVKKGQRLIYERLVMDGNGKHVAVLCYHNVPNGRQVDTRTDIEHFQAMYFNCHLRDVRYSDIRNGCEWEQFVKQWFDNPEVVLNTLADGFEFGLWDIRST